MQMMMMKIQMKALMDMQSPGAKRTISLEMMCLMCRAESQVEGDNPGHLFLLFHPHGKDSSERNSDRKKPMREIKDYLELETSSTCCSLFFLKEVQL